jgi:DNA-binding NarL/FixJ family response regulator
MEYGFSIENAANDWIGTPTAWLVIYPDPTIIEWLMKSNIHVWGILSPDASQSELMATERALSEGLTVINPSWVKYLSESRVISNASEPELVEPLTGREMDILQLLALGLTNKQIAGKLSISAHTVKFHVSSIYGKMGTSNRTETVKLGLKMGLILL